MATYWENSCSFGLQYVSWYKYLIVSLFFSHLGFGSGNLFLIAPFPDLCLLVPFKVAETAVWPIPFLINMLTALKGSQFYFYCWVKTERNWSPMMLALLRLSEKAMSSFFKGSTPVLSFFFWI